MEAPSEISIATIGTLHLMMASWSGVQVVEKGGSSRYAREGVVIAERCGFGVYMGYTGVVCLWLVV